MFMQLLQILLVPLVFVFITYYAGTKWGSKAGWLAFIALAYSTILTLLAGAHDRVAMHVTLHILKCLHEAHDRGQKTIRNVLRALPTLLNRNDGRGSGNRPD